MIFVEKKKLSTNQMKTVTIERSNTHTLCHVIKGIPKIISDIPKMISNI